MAEGNLKTLLPSIYLENKKISGDLAPFVYEGDVPNRYPQAYENALNKIGESFGVVRGPNEEDEAYRQKIKLRVVQSPTKSGIKKSIETVFSGLGLNVTANVFDSSDSYFDAVQRGFDFPLRGLLSSRLYRVSINLTPGFKSYSNNFIKDISSGENYRIENSGYYSIYFDPKKQNEGSSVKLTKIYVQGLSFDEVIIDSMSVSSGYYLDLGFLTQFQSIFMESNSPFYKAYLEYNNKQFDFYKNPAYNGLITAFGVSFLTEVFSEVTSFGIIIERINIKQAGTGGYF